MTGAVSGEIGLTMLSVAEKMLVSLMLAVLLTVGVADTSSAQYFRRPVSALDPSIMQIDEKAVLGRAIDPATPLIDHRGRAFRWGDFLGKPTILVLAYYTCDGSCAVVNTVLADLLKQTSRLRPGEDFNVVTISFDRHDTLETTGAFKKHLDLTKDLDAQWTFATFANETDLKAQTEKIGFKFFWSAEDRTFLHPGAFLFFSPEGKLARVLYQQEVGPKDVELAVLDSRMGQFKPREVLNFALSLCYSYSYQDGKYGLNIPLFVGLGALLTGLTTFIAFVLLYRGSRRGQLRRV